MVKASWYSWTRIKEDALLNPQWLWGMIVGLTIFHFVL